MERSIMDDGLGLSLCLKTFEKSPPPPPPPPPPQVLAPPLKPSSTSICRRLSSDRFGSNKSIFNKVDHFLKSPPQDGGSKTQQLAPYTTLNLGWIGAKSNPRNKGLDRDMKVLAPNNELSNVAGKRSAEREVIISDGEDDCDVYRGNGGVGPTTGGGGGEGREKKKLRLSKEQSSLLEKTFLEHSTLNNKQKLYLAKQSKLTPRQVEVWFQNRRARTKLKQTEVDCEFLRKYCERLSDENRRLHKQLKLLTSKANPPSSTLVGCHACKCGSSTPSSVSLTVDDGRPRHAVGASNLPPSEPININVSGRRLLYNNSTLLKI